jgi:hypothetical protein
MKKNVIPSVVTLCVVIALPVAARSVFLYTAHRRPLHSR